MNALPDCYPGVEAIAAAFFDACPNLDRASRADQREAGLAAIDVYVMAFNLARPWRPAEIERSIEAIRRTIGTLSSQVADLDEWALSIARGAEPAILEAEKRRDKAVRTGGDVDAAVGAWFAAQVGASVDKRALAALGEFEACLQVALERTVRYGIPGRGAPKNRAANGVARALASHYARLSGKNPTYSTEGRTPFKSLVVAAFAVLGIVADPRRPAEAAIKTLVS